MQRIDYLSVKYEISSFDMNYRGAFDFNEGIALVKESDGKYSYILANGEKLFSKSFCIALSFSDGLAMVKKNALDKYFVYINRQGEVVLKQEHRVSGSFVDGVAMFGEICEDCNKLLYGLMNRTGETIIESQYLDMKLGIGSIAVKHRNGKWGIINKNGDILVPFKFEDANPFENGIALVKKDDEEFYIDSNAQKIHKKRNDNFLNREYRNDYKTGWIEDKIGYVNKEGMPLMIKEQALISYLSQIPSNAKNIEILEYISVFNIEDRDIFVKDKDFRMYMSKRRKIEEIIEKDYISNIQDIFISTMK